MRFVLLFRGLNVGGKHKVTMAALADMLRALGLSGVQTYIQSGNAIVETQLGGAALGAAVSNAFEAQFGFASGVVAISAPALRAVVAGLPFSQADIAAANALNPETEHLYAYLLPQAPDPATAAALAVLATGGDRLHLEGRTLYADSVRTSKAAARITRLLPDATARNWRTVLALLALAEGETP